VTVHATAGIDTDAPVVALRGVSKSWSDVPLLAGLDFDVRPGTLTVLVGPSGSGKTTVLTILAEWTRPDAGALEWRDGFTAELRARWRHVAVLPRIGLLPDDPAENVAPLPSTADTGGRGRAHSMLDVLALARSPGGWPPRLLGQRRAALKRRNVARPPTADGQTSHQDPRAAAGTCPLP
jgi:ABC-type nitrate/sulfonate/bicarbonate transport system ATPase subunit